MQYVIIDLKGRAKSIHTINQKTQAVPRGAVIVTPETAAEITSKGVMDEWVWTDSGFKHQPKARPYKQVRRGEYPDVGEQLGAIVKGLEQLFKAHGLTPNPDTQALFDAVENVKTKVKKETS
jgi:alcohol dehydrogenase YqhD (iron-dependent ADH family)